VLSDAQKRAAYDRFGHAGVDPNASGMGGGAGLQVFLTPSAISLARYLAVLGVVGVAVVVLRFTRGADLKYAMEVSLEQAANGTETEIRVPSWESCGVCSGSGAKPGSSPVSCRTCGGAGAVRMQQGFFSVQPNLPRRVMAQAKKSKIHATRAAGSKSSINKTLQVKIPAGNR